MNKGDIVIYHGRKAKIIGEALKCGKLRYKIRLYDKFHTIIYNISGRDLINDNKTSRE